MITGFAKGRPSVEPTAKALLRLHYLVSDLHVPGKYGPTAGCSFGHLSRVRTDIRSPDTLVRTGPDTVRDTPSPEFYVLRRDMSDMRRNMV